MIAFDKQHAIDSLKVTRKLQRYSFYSEEIILPYSAEKLFDLVADIEHYPDFLPGWKSVSVKKSYQNRLYVEQEFGFPLFSFKGHSVAELDRPHHLLIVVEDGPFRHLEIDWYFHSISSSVVRVSLSMKTDANSGLQLSLLQQFLNYSTGSLLEYFERRAKNIFKTKNRSVLNRSKGG